MFFKTSTTSKFASFHPCQSPSKTHPKNHRPCVCFPRDSGDQRRRPPPLPSRPARRGPRGGAPAAAAAAPRSAPHSRRSRPPTARQRGDVWGRGRAVGERFGWFLMVQIREKNVRMRTNLGDWNFGTCFFALGDGGIGTLICGDSISSTTTEISLTTDGYVKYNMELTNEGWDIGTPDDLKWAQPETIHFQSQTLLSHLQG